MLDEIGHYKVLDRIGAGRIGELFRARDTRAGRTVALRAVSEEITGTPGTRRLFLQDARAAAALSHPNLAAIYEIREQGGRVFLVSEFVPGEPLSTLISGRALNPRHAVERGIQLADALAEAHAAGILHRDIRPRHILVTPKGIAKFIDYGLAAWTTAGAERQRIASASGDNAGTLDDVEYMAPEYVLGRAVDPRADVFSLGAVLFEMFTGTPPPLVAPTPHALTADVVQAPPPPPSTLNAELPRELDRIVLKMLARNPDDRYEGAPVVAAELRAVAAVLGARAGVPEPAGTPAVQSRRQSATWIVIVLAVMAVLAALVFLMR
jgi:serine/threonine-protein kinase